MSKKTRLSVWVDRICFSPPADISLISVSLFVLFLFPLSNLDIDKLSGNYVSFLLYLTDLSNKINPNCFYVRLILSPLCIAQLYSVSCCYWLQFSDDDANSSMTQQSVAELLGFCLMQSVLFWLVCLCLTHSMFKVLNKSIFSSRILHSTSGRICQRPVRSGKAERGHIKGHG